MTYVPPPCLTIQIPRGKLVIGHEWRRHFARYEDFYLSEDIALGIWPSEPLTVKQLLYSWLPPIQQFFMLGTGKRMELISLDARPSEACSGMTDEETKSVPFVHIYPPPKERVAENKSLDERDMIFGFLDIRSQVEAHLVRWAALYDIISPVLHMFFAEVMAPDGYSVQTLLCAAQAAEAYHRHRRSGTELPEEQHKTILDALLRSIPDDTPREYRNSLENRLRYSNEMSQRKRLRELLAERDLLFCLNAKDRNRLVDKIIGMRNFFTHYSEKKQVEEFTTLEYYIYPALLKWTLVACLLEEIGISREDAYRLICRNGAFRYFQSVHLKNHLSTLWNESSLMKGVQNETPEDGS